MSLFRYDVTTNDWVIFAPERAKRPHQYASAPNGSGLSDKTCPFCPGNEHLTGQEILAIRDAAGRHVRVIPNKFPVLGIEEQNSRQSIGNLFREMGGCGAHEVVIESRHHDHFLGHQPVDHVARLLGELRARFVDLLKDARFQTIVIFKNHGERAGTSLRHPHWELIATPVVPRMLRVKHAVATDYFDQTGRCLYCVLLEEEFAFQERVLTANDDFVALLPYAAHVPFEVWIMPRKHCASFGRVTDRQLRPLAEILKEVLSRLHAGLEDPDFNLTINTAPRGDEDKEYFLWHMQIFPRLTTTAGFELGSGMAINTVLPETGTSFLRGIENHLIGSGPQQ